MTDVLLTLTDTTIELTRLIDTRAKTFVNAATVMATLADAAGTPVSGVTWPLAMPAVAGVPGAYRAVLPLEAALTPGEFYTLSVAVDAGLGLRRTFVERLPCVAPG